MTALSKYLGAAIDCGFEAQSNTVNAEGAGYGPVGTAGFDTGVFHSGAASLKATAVGNGVSWTRATSAGVEYPVLSLDTEYRWSFYLRFSTGSPTANSTFARLYQDQVSTIAGALRINTTGKVQLLNASQTLVATGATTLAADAWNLIEWRFQIPTGGGANSISSVWVNGTQEVSSSTVDHGAAAIQVLELAMRTSVGTRTWYWDDVHMDDPAHRFVLSDSTAKTSTLAKSDSVTPTDSATKATTLAKSDSVTPTDTTAKAVGHPQSDAVTLSDSAVSADTAAHGDSVTTSDSIATTAAYVRQLADTATVSDEITFSGTAYQPAPPAPGGGGFAPIVRVRRPRPLEGKDYELKLTDLVVLTDRLTYKKELDPILREEEELLALI